MHSSPCLCLSSVWWNIFKYSVALFVLKPVKCASAAANACNSPLLNSVLRRSVRKSISLEQKQQSNVSSDCATLLCFTPPTSAANEPDLNADTVDNTGAVQTTEAATNSVLAAGSVEATVLHRMPLRSILHNSGSKQESQEMVVAPSVPLPTTSRKSTRLNVTLSLSVDCFTWSDFYCRCINYTICIMPRHGQSACPQYQLYRQQVKPKKKISLIPVSVRP